MKRSKCLSLIEFIAIALSVGGALSACATPPVERKAGYGHYRQAIQARKQTVAQVHRQNRAEIRSCLARGESADVATGPSTVEVEIRLHASGTPSRVRVVEAADIPAASRACLEEVFANLRYGQARRGATFYQKLTYDARGGELSLDEPVDAYHRWGLSGEEIERALRDGDKAIGQCYARAVDPKKGRVVLTLAIGADGQVARVGVKKSSLADSTVGDCLVESILGMTFPAPRGGGVVVVDVPFQFTPEDGWTGQMHLVP